MTDELRDPVAWRNTRPGKRMGAGAVLRDAADRVLLVKPTYTDGWELPGGSTEADESPRESCRRELVEELGLDLEPGWLLVLQWQPPEPDRTGDVPVRRGRDRAAGVHAAAGRAGVPRVRGIGGPSTPTSSRAWPFSCAPR